MAEVDSKASGEMGVHKEELLYDIYKKEAEDLMSQQRYNMALQAFSRAITLLPDHTAALLGRSRCYLYMSKTGRALQDAERALSIDASDTDAVFQKAEILYLSGQYQLASVYYKRGLKLAPDSSPFQQGIERASHALQKFGPGVMSKNKMSAVGDLSFFLTTKRRHTTLGSVGDDKEERGDVPSAGFRSRPHCPLFRITRKPRIPHLKSFTCDDLALTEVGGLHGADREDGTGPLSCPDENTMRKILGELYGDRQYLQRLQADLPGGRAERDMAVLADDGLEFLRERSVFWDTLGPLPPPVPARVGLKRESTVGFIDRQLILRQQRHLEPTMPQRDVTQVHFVFRSHLTTRARARRGADTRESSRPRLESRGLTGPPNADSSRPRLMGGVRRGGRGAKGKVKAVFVDPKDKLEANRPQLTAFINREMDAIDDAFKEGEYEECVERAERCLQAVRTVQGEQRVDVETVASLHSCMGNASLALRLYERAATHHKTALAIGQQQKNATIMARSLSHLGRMYIIKRQFNRALQVFARKAPLCSSLEEVAQTFHEVGNCFLVLGHFDYARDCGHKSLRAAQGAQLPFFVQQAWILIAIAQAKLDHFKESYKAFAAALKVAEQKGDTQSVKAISSALKHVGDKLQAAQDTKSRIDKRLQQHTQALATRHKPGASPPRRKPRPVWHTHPFVGLESHVPMGHVNSEQRVPGSMRVTAHGVGVDDDFTDDETLVLADDEDDDDEAEFDVGWQDSLRLDLADDHAPPGYAGMFTERAYPVTRDDPRLLQTERYRVARDRRHNFKEVSFNRQSTLRAREIYAPGRNNVTSRHTDQKTAHRQKPKLTRKANDSEKEASNQTKGDRKKKCKQTQNGKALTRAPNWHPDRESADGNSDSDDVATLTPSLTHSRRSSAAPPLPPITPRESATSESHTSDHVQRQQQLAQDRNDTPQDRNDTPQDRNDTPQDRNDTPQDGVVTQNSDTDQAGCDTDTDNSQTEQDTVESQEESDEGQDVMETGEEDVASYHSHY